MPRGSRGSQRGQVEGDQVGDGQQQPGHGGVRAAGQGGEVGDGRGWQRGVPAGGGRADAGPGRGAAQQPPESFLAQDVADTPVRLSMACPSAASRALIS